MALKTSCPPAFDHASLTKTLTASAAQAQLAAFLTKTETSPFLHPDALLSPHGISYAAQSGPTGGLAIHHLRRIAAGLRGENLVAETAEELAQFGAAADEAELPAGDDSRVNALIAAGDDVRRKKNSDEISQWAEASTGTRFDEEGMDLDEYQLEQQPLEGEVGEIEGAPVVQQNGLPPKIVHEDDASKRPLTEKDKAARRQAKKARNKANRVEKHRTSGSAS